jgi:RNA polymerase sigma-70 factor (ECF subfamily)
LDDAGLPEFILFEHQVAVASTKSLHQLLYSFDVQPTGPYVNRYTGGVPNVGGDFDQQFIDQYPRLVAELDFILGSVDLARDIAQDAFVRQYLAWKRVSTYDQPGAWVRRVAIRMAMRLKTRYDRETTLDHAAHLSTQPEDSARNIDVRRAIGRLTKPQRVAIVLYYYRDFAVPQVAQALGCKEATARVHLHQARKRLAELLVAYDPKNS